MSELNRISNNSDGQLPSGSYQILKIKNYPDASEELETFKNFMIAFLENKSLDPSDDQWNSLIPERIIKFSEQLEEYDLQKDEFLHSLGSIIDSLQTIKDWEWYSSKITSDGFEVVVTGTLYIIFIGLVHHLGIPLSSIFVEIDGEEFPQDSSIDILSYREWDRETMVLSSGEVDYNQFTLD